MPYQILVIADLSVVGYFASYWSKCCLALWS